MLSCHSQNSTPKISYHEVVVAEVLQAIQYTYLRVTENEDELWLALPKTDAEIGNTYYYKGGFLMTAFKSKDLDRTFEEVYFIDGISTEPKALEKPAAHASMAQAGTPQNPPTETASIHKAVVKEILQANKYTYLLVKENEAELWVALPKTEAEIGKTYYYKEGFLMTAFESKDLSRTFDEVYFITGVSENPITGEGAVAHANTPPAATSSQNTPTQTASIHEVVVKEILQANKYTYLRVTENGAEHWVALPKTDAELGKTYYYEGGSLMTGFKSKDLDRTFEEVYFITGISDVSTAKKGGNHSQSLPYTANTTTEAVKEVKIKPAKGGITIAQLYSKIETYADKLVKIKGEVTKYNAKIMGKNWIHIQDGTDHSGHFDLTATTDADLKVGDVVYVEGKITLNKDFGYGYFYEVIMEDAKILKE